MARGAFPRLSAGGMKSAAITDVFTVQAVSAATVRLISAAPLGRVVAATNASLAPIAWDLLVPPTLTAGLG